MACTEVLCWKDHWEIHMYVLNLFYLLFSSFTNPQEVKLVVELIKTIKEKRKDIGSRNIGIITPYNAQKKIIQQELDREFGKDR